MSPAKNHIKHPEMRAFKIGIKSKTDYACAPQGQQPHSPGQSVAAPWV